MSPRRLAESVVPLFCLSLACTGAGAHAGDLEIQVSAGLTPEYSWPAGHGFSLGVTRISAPATVVWAVADSGARLVSPIRHGAPPGGADLVSAVEPALTPGVRYRVTVALADGRTGSREFTAIVSRTTP